MIASLRTVVVIGLLPVLTLPLTGARATPRMTVARLQYDGGGDWYANPSSLPNLLAAIRERTSLPVEKSEACVTLTDESCGTSPCCT